MAWVDPSTVATGDVLTAATWNQAVVANTLAGLPSFTTEAARDAVITSPAEGMMCYLTAPTIPAATGVTTNVPSGVRTVYNGSVWVCVTPIGSSSATQGTTNSTSYVTTLTSDGTAMSVTLVTGTTALVTMFWRGYADAINRNQNYAVSVSGASTIAASDAQSLLNQVPNVAGTNTEQCLERTFFMTGLTAGTNTFTLNYKTNAGTITCVLRDLIVQGVA